MDGLSAFKFDFSLKCHFFIQIRKERETRILDQSVESVPYSATIKLYKFWTEAIKWKPTFSILYTYFPGFHSFRKKMQLEIWNESKHTLNSQCNESVELHLSTDAQSEIIDVLLTGKSKISDASVKSQVQPCPRSSEDREDIKRSSRLAVFIGSAGFKISPYQPQPW
jgi:hypothetical protein